MKAPIGLLWPTVAGLAALIAFLAGPTYAIAVPAATVAVIAAGLALIAAVASRPDNEWKGTESSPVGPGGIRAAFNEGLPGREDIVMALDLLERKLLRPDLPARTVSEYHELAGRSPDDFRQYVADRLDELEGPM